MAMKQNAGEKKKGKKKTTVFFFGFFPLQASELIKCNLDESWTKAFPEKFESLSNL